LKFVQGLIETLGIIKSQESIPAIIPFLSSPQLAIGTTTVKALENIGKEFVGDQLNSYFENEDNGVYFDGEALEVLENLTDRPVNLWR
jgi:HEAT repeat protein